MTRSEINILVGLQWGSEDKESLTKLLSETSDLTVRYQGGARDGAGFAPGNEEQRINFLPAGISVAGTKSLICRETFIDLELIGEEIKRTKKMGLLKSQLTISKACPIVFDFHRKQEILQRTGAWRDHEAGLMWGGIASAAGDKYARLGIKAADLLSPRILREKTELVLKIKNTLFSRAFGAAEFDINGKCEEYLRLAEIVKPYVGDAEGILASAVKANLRIFFEGVGGAMQNLDTESCSDAAPYPTLASSVFRVAGAKPLFLARIIGVAKAYVTRTGGDLLISEEKGGIASFIRNRGGERGDVSVGWLDLPALKYALRENGADVLVMTKLNVLTGIDELKICTGYRVGLAERCEFDLTEEEREKAEPVYKVFSGWREDLSSLSGPYNLPAETQTFMRYVEEAVKVPVVWADVGATRLSELNAFH